MKIVRIAVYRIELPFVDGPTRLSGGLVLAGYDNTLVRVETDAGLIGQGEICPIGRTYLPAFAAGARAAIAEMVPSLLGADPRELTTIWRRMDGALKGHGYAKCPLDIACWDLLGQAAGVPVSTLLGGRHADRLALYRVVSQDTPAAMAAMVAAARAAGHRTFQLKVGGDPAADIERIRACAAETGPGDRLIADANGGWRQDQALQVVRAVRALDLAIEQPCATYEECLAVRRATDLPFVLDESVDGLPMLLRAWRDRACDAVNVKVSKAGGLTPLRLMRDLCGEFGLPMTLEDSGAGTVNAAAVAHLCAATPPRLLYSVTSSATRVGRPTALGGPRFEGATMTVPEGPGLGVAPLSAADLGPPAFEATL